MLVLSIGRRLLMSSITQVSEEMEMILSQRAKALERSTGFVQRSTAQLDGPIFAQTTVLTWMHHPQAGYAHLRITAASLGVSVSKQAIEQRFSASSTRFLEALFAEAVAVVINSEGKLPQVLDRFNGVYLQDGTIISLPQTLAQPWPAGAGTGKGAAVRVQARLEVGHGQLAGVWLQAGHEAERSGPAIQTPLAVGSLFNADMGYFTLQHMPQRGQQGQYWLTQAKATLCLIDAHGRSCDPLAAGRLDDSAHQRPHRAARGGRSLGAGALSLANRTAVEAVETRGQARYVGQLQTGAHLDGNLCQTAWPAHHALADPHRLLASSQPQSASSQTGGRVDDSLPGVGLCRSAAPGACRRPQCANAAWLSH